MFQIARFRAPKPSVASCCAPAGILHVLRWVFALSLAAYAHAAEASKGFVLEIDVADARGGVVQLFYNTGYGYNQHDSLTAQLPAGDTLQTLKFQLPAAPIKHLRLDPSTGETTIRMGEWRLLTGDGRLLKRIGPERVRPMFDIKSIARENGVSVIHTGSTDPMLMLDEPTLHPLTHEALGRRSVGRAEVLAVGFVLFAALLFAVSGAFRAAAVGAPGSKPTRFRPEWLCFAGVFLVVFGARLYWLAQYSRAMPFWDEWESDALYLLMPLSGGFLDWQALVIPQSEHRIVITRFITLVGSWLNGEWDPRIGMVAGAAMISAATALAAVTVMSAGRWIGGLAVIVMAAMMSLPFDQANILWGGQSQMYALNLLGLCTLLLAAAPKPDLVTGLAALAAGTLSLATMGAGFVAPAVAGGICALRFMLEPERRRGIAALFGIFVVVAVAGVLWREASHWHAGGYARTWAAFWKAFKGFAAWPLPGHGGTLVVLWLPWLAISMLAVLRKATGTLVWLAAGLGAWALLAAVGLAHGRPELAWPIDSKYFTALSFGTLASVLSTAALLQSLSRVWPKVVFATASLAAVVALLASGERGKGGAAQHHYHWTEQDPLVHRFLATGDRALMQDVGAINAPYWNSAELAQRLESPLLQPLLPAELRKSLNQRPGMKLDDSPGPLTVAMFTAFETTGVFILAGFAGLVIALWKTRFRGIDAQSARTE